MKPFFLTQSNGTEYQTAFFTYINEFARNCAKSMPANVAHEEAKKTVFNLFSPIKTASLNGTNVLGEIALWDLLQAFYRSDTFITTEFFQDGKKVTTNVYWPVNDNYPVTA